ncbi:hypothetical protein CCACVL1_23833, partial [Corchorus capsularis]
MISFIFSLPREFHFLLQNEDGISIEIYASIPAIFFRF